MKNPTFRNQKLNELTIRDPHVNALDRLIKRYPQDKDLILENFIVELVTVKAQMLEQLERLATRIGTRPVN